MESQCLTQLSILAHAQRMRVFRLLVRRYPDDVPASEIGAVLGLKPSTTSVYLSALREAGLIEQRRQATSLLYRACLDQLRGLVDFLIIDCCQGRPELCTQTNGPMARGSAGPDRRYNVLFLCTGNSARSIFAESLLRQAAGERFCVHSAGTMPSSELNPIAVEMLRDKGHDVGALESKNISVFQSHDAPQMDFVFTVCDQAANEECPPWNGQPLSAHWGMPDPVKVTGTDAEKRLAFQQTYGMLKKRVEAFAALPIETLDRISLQVEIDRIGIKDA